MTGVDHLLHTLRSQGRFCRQSGSAMYAELFDRVAVDVETGGVFAAILAGREDTPSRHAVPLRLLGGLHRMVLDGRAAELRRWYPSTGGTWDADAAWPQILHTAAAHTDALRAALDSAPQTNEVGRSAALVGGLLLLGHEFGFPIRLFEIGTSAGLNLRADRYRYRFGDDAGGHWGPSGSPVTIDDAWRGSRPPRGALHIVERYGYDIAPIDVTTADGELTALSYVWPDQRERLDRLRGAISVAHEVPAQVVRRSAGEAVAGIELAEGTLTVLWHSITWQYLAQPERAAIRDAVGALAAAATARSPFAHLTLEPARDGPGAPLKFLVRLRSWPHGELRLLGECHPHGPPVHWF